MKDDKAGNLIFLQSQVYALLSALSLSGGQTGASVGKKNYISHRPQGTVGTDLQVGKTVGGKTRLKIKDEKAGNVVFLRSQVYAFLSGLHTFAGI